MLQQAVLSKARRIYSTCTFMSSASSCQPSEPAKIRRVIADRVEWVVELLPRSVSGVLPDTHHFRVRGSSVTRERLNRLTTSCEFRFNFTYTWLSWKKLEILLRHACHATFSLFTRRWLVVVHTCTLSCTIDPVVLRQVKTDAVPPRTRRFFPLRALANFENTILQLQ